MTSILLPRRLVFGCGVLVGCLLGAQAALAVPIDFNAIFGAPGSGASPTGDKKTFVLNLTSKGPVTANDSAKAIPDPFVWWDIVGTPAQVLAFVEPDGPDELRVFGRVFHRPVTFEASHDHKQAGDPFDFDVEIDADDAVVDANGVFRVVASPIGPQNRNHKNNTNHFDIYRVSLEGTTDANTDVLLTWKFGLSGLHDPPEEISEPETLVALGCGFAGLALWMRGRRRRRSVGKAVL